MKIPFQRLMELLDALPEEDWQLPMGVLAERWGEPVSRIADAIDALRVLHGEQTYIRSCFDAFCNIRTSRFTDSRLS